VRQFELVTPLKAFSLLIVLSTEMLLYLVGAVYFSKYLNKALELSFDSVYITVAFSLLLCGFSLYRFFGKIIKYSDKKAV
jgi:hypothetical protein